MQAAVLTEPGAPLALREVPRPVPGPGQILVKLQACGVCHSDVHIWQGEVSATPQPEPFALGHEGVGTVAALGPGVTDWALGEPAGVPWLHDTCLACAECLEGQESFCQHQRAHGLNVPGAFAEYVVADARFAARLTPGLDPLLTAPVMCAGVTAYGAIRRAALKPGETLAVFGCGGLGLYAVQIAARQGLRVIAVDRDPKKLAIAAGYGAAETELADGTLVQRLEQPARKSHACINFAPTPHTWSAMLAAIRPRGRIVAAALVYEPVPLSQGWLTGTGVVITGTSVGTRREMDEVVALHAARPLRAEITRIGLGQATEALQALARGEAPGRFVIAF